MTRRSLVADCLRADRAYRALCVKHTPGHLRYEAREAAIAAISRLLRAWR